MSTKNSPSGASQDSDEGKGSKEGKEAKEDSIVSKSARGRLKPRREPYWHSLEPGLFVGYRRLQREGEGTWLARWWTGSRQQFEALGCIIDTEDGKAFKEAKERAHKWHAHIAACGAPDVRTVEGVCRAYVEWLAKQSGQESANNAALRFKRLVYGQTIGAVRMAKLKKHDVVKWHHARVRPATEGAEAVRKSKNTANRDLRGLKAALNYAHKMQLIASDSAWAGVEAFKNVKGKREGFLPIEVRQKLLGAANENIRPFMLALLLLGCRPGELALVTAGDFNRYNRTLRIVDRGEKKRGRTITLSNAAFSLFEEMVKGKLPLALMFTNSKGGQWVAKSWNLNIKEAVQKAGLDPSISAYYLRHTSISAMLIEGIDIKSVATYTGTSVKMIDDHYGHLVHGHIQARLNAVNFT